MSEFKNVTVVNLYFDGKVVSRAVLFADGSKKTLGIMQPGEYEFGTGDTGIMEILSGELDVSLPGAEGWRPLKGGESFEGSRQRQVPHEGEDADGLLLFAYKMTRQHFTSCLFIL